ncbi:Prolyl 3-hydroxylase ogfod1 [Balamuthia mandrillaris]
MECHPEQHDPAIKEVLEELSQRLNPPKQAFEAALATLEANWITRLSSWGKLTPSQRDQLALPLLLKNELDALSLQQEQASKKKRANDVGEKERTVSAEGVQQSSNKRAKGTGASAAAIDVKEEGEALAVLNPEIVGEEWVQKAKQAYESKAHQPFSHNFLEGFLKESFIDSLRDELLTLSFQRKSNDLYDFYQSKDLKGCSLPAVSKLRATLYSQSFRQWLSKITGIEGLNDTIDMSVARYTDTSTLLCHDDELEGRRIAYILYLVPKDWDTATEGGTLDLFAVDESTKQPVSIAESISPTWNSFVFFAVSEVSWHQVSEVRTADQMGFRERMSISGWFHGPPLPKNTASLWKEPPPPYLSPLPTLASSASSTSKQKEKAENEEESLTEEMLGVLQKWLNPIYLAKENQEAIREEFLEESSIQLNAFLRDDKYEQVMEELCSDEDEHQHIKEWRFKGPVNKRHYMCLPDTEERHTIQQLSRFLRSDVFFSFLRYITGLDLATVTYQIRKFLPGTYTLVHDGIIEEEALDVFLCCSTNDIEVDCGGQVIYMDEETELLSVPCQMNTLSLTYRDKGTMKFVKYLNNHCKDIRFDWAMIFKENEKNGEEEQQR